MSSPLAPTRFVLVSLVGLGLAVFALDSCGPAETYTRLGAEGFGTGGVPVGEGTGGSGGVSVVGPGGAAGGSVAASGGMTANGGTAVGGAGARPAGGAGGSAPGGGQGGSSPGSGGVAATGGASVGGKGGAGTGAVGTGGVVATGGVTGTGGVSAGGAKGTGGAATGGVPATGGTSTGGVAAGGSKGGGGMGGGGASGGNGGGFGTPTVIDCSAPTVPASGILSDFNRQPPATGRWASSNGLIGTLFAFATNTSTATATVGDAPGDLHLTASVIANSYAGGGILFDSCQSIGSYTSIRFSVSGTNSCPIWLQMQTYNLKPNTDTPQGGCTTNCLNYPTVQNVPLTPSPITVPLSSFSPWSSTLAGQVVGVYWFLDNLGTSSACATDLHFDNITLVP